MNKRVSKFFMNEDAKRFLVGMSDGSIQVYGYERRRWATDKKEFSISEANSFFIGEMLNKRNPGVGRQFATGRLFINKYYNGDKAWQRIRDTCIVTLRSILKKSFDIPENDTPFKGSFHRNMHRFPEYLKANACMMIEKYDGDPRNIWNVTPENVEKIFERFKEFHGFGYGLARIAQIDLVMKYGVAGGEKSKFSLKVKPDTHVRRVTHRLGLSETDKQKDVVDTINSFGRVSQGDTDHILFTTGREYCDKRSPKCTKCWFGREHVCSYAGRKA